MEQADLKLGLANVVPPMKAINSKAISLLKHEGAAVRECIDQSVVTKTQENWAKHLGYKNTGPLNRILTRTGSKPLNLSAQNARRLQVLAGNYAIEQYRCAKLGLVPIEKAFVEGMKATVEALRKENQMLRSMMAGGVAYG